VHAEQEKGASLGRWTCRSDRVFSQDDEDGEALEYGAMGGGTMDFASVGGPGWGWDDG